MASLSSAAPEPPAAEGGGGAVVPAGEEAAEEELSPEEIISKYKTMRTQIRDMATKMDELELEFNEHQLVISSLKPMEPERKCFRHIQGVLVQQTVGEVLPGVTDYQTMIKQLLDNVSTSLTAKEKEAAAWKVKYKIQTQQERELARAQQQEQAAVAKAVGSGGGGKTQGVLA